MTDFIPIGGIAKFALVLNAGPSLPHKSVREFIRAAKANPGKYSFGSGTATIRLAGELLQSTAGIKMLSVPYKSQTDAIWPWRALKWISYLWIYQARAHSTKPGAFDRWRCQGRPEWPRYQLFPRFKKKGSLDMK